MRIFNETQRFTQWWLQLINLVLLGLLVYAVYNWFFLNKAVGNVSTDNHSEQIIALAVIPLSLLLIYLFKLETTIDEIGIHYQFLPINLAKKTIRWSELKNCYVRTYKPIAEYG